MAFANSASTPGQGGNKGVNSVNEPAEKAESNESYTEAEKDLQLAL
jgi:hypothetical protein